MYVIPKLRLNVFNDVRIPSNKDLYVQFGMRNVVRSGSVGSDGAFTEPVNLSMDKINEMSLGQKQLQNLADSYELEKQEAAERQKQADELAKKSAAAESAASADTPTV